MAQAAVATVDLPGSGAGVLCLDAADLWNDARFRAKVLTMLAASGFDSGTVDLVRQVFDQSSTPDFEAFRRAALAFASRPSQGGPDRLKRVVQHLQQVRDDNSTIYGPKTPAEYKARYWPNNAKLRQTRWEYFEDLYEADIFTQTFRFITKETPIVSAGSCFAANISRQLQYWQYNYLVEMGQPAKDDGHIGNYPTDPAGCGNIYNVVSMRQMVERAFGEWTPEKILVASRPEYVDAFRPLVDYDDLDGYHRKWEEHSAALGRAMRKCEVFILTLGMTEAWFFADSGLATSAAPRKGDATLYRYRDLSVEENVAELERIHELFVKHNPRAKIIATVSPVPLNATFHRDRHVVVANSLSKATLRVALEIISRRYPDQYYYFPSYEVVTTATRAPWDIDLRHVSNEAVTRVMRQFQRMFMVDQTPLDILPLTPLGEIYSQSRAPVLRGLREYVVHPLKRMLDIEGQPMRAVFSRWSRRS